MGKAVSKNVNDEQIKAEVNEYPVVIYTKRSCGYCKLAKDLLDGEKMRYVEKDLDAVRDPEGHNAYVNGLVYITRRTTVPQVFACGRFIGGYTELEKLREAKQLWEAVEKCYDSYYGGSGHNASNVKM